MSPKRKRLPIAYNYIDWEASLHCGHKYGGKDDYKSNAVGFAKSTLSKEMKEENFEEIKKIYQILFDRKTENLYMLDMIISNEELLKRCVTINDGSWLQFRIWYYEEANKLVLEYYDGKICVWENGDLTEKLSELADKYTLIPIQIQFKPEYKKEKANMH